MDAETGAAHVDADELGAHFRAWVVAMCASRQGEVGVPTLAELEGHRPHDQWYFEWRAYDMAVAALTGVAKPLTRAEMSEVRDFSRSGHIAYGRAKHHLALLLADAGLPDCEPAAGEPYAWGMVANVSRDFLTPKSDGILSAGTSGLAPGAKVWVVPPMWGDGGDMVLVIGTRRGSRGRRLVRQVMGSEKLVNFRAKPVFSRRDWARMVSPYRGSPPQMWGGDGAQQDVSEYAEGWGVQHLKRVHLRGIPWGRTWRQPLHPRDQKCAFCEGAGARFDDAAGHEPNPYDDRGPGTDAAELLNRQLWDAGRRYAALFHEPTIPKDSPFAGLVREVAARHEKAVELAPDLVGRLVDDVRTVRAEDPDHRWSSAPIHFTSLDERLPYTVGRVVARVDGNFIADAWAE